MPGKTLTDAQIALYFGQWIKNFEAVCFLAFWKSNSDKLKYLTWESKNIKFILDARNKLYRDFDKYRVNVTYTDYPYKGKAGYEKYINGLKNLLYQLRVQLAVLLNLPIQGISPSQILQSLDKLIEQVKP